MPKKKDKDKVGASGRFGPRYGTRIRERVRAVEEKSKDLHRCPECEAKKVERISSGIWKCSRCGTKFAAKSYAPDTTPIKKLIESEVKTPKSVEESSGEE